MDKEVCKRFKNVREWISDELIEGKYKFNDFVLLNNDCNHSNFLNNSCNNNNFQNDLDRISAGCLYLLDEFIKDCGVVPSPAKYNINIVDYILIWLSYMLNLGNSDKKNIDNFYNQQINSCDQYKTQINELNDYDYNNYKKLIDTKKELLYMGSNIVSKFYEALKLLCNLYNELDDEKKKCKKYLDDNNEFFKKYEKLKNDSDVTGNELYNQLLSTLLNDYNNFKTECNVTSSPPSEETLKNHGQDLVRIFGKDVGDLVQNVDDLVQDIDDSEHTVQNLYVVSSSSSIVSKLIPVLLIFGAIPIFLGISYKVNNKELKKKIIIYMQTLKKK
ncbi:hypothetical protein YYC_03870 [Plasmodium yoelii 17X]|uniref:Uncharacterized protein n=1 Tax=Plasmodium yoelii 17X TaxID=1323249 RepID=V7PG57_PLAYE|nr:hypothetical protein YYC_03870 [Plasmodium yoelii 17X]